VVTLLAAAVYLVGGIAFNMKMQASPSWRDAFPHKSMWLSLGGLVMDGAQVSTARAHAQGAYSSVRVSAHMELLTMCCMGNLSSFSFRAPKSASKSPTSTPARR
jgi:hypothetical protein